MDWFFRSGIADSTQRAYDSAKRRFLHFCMHHNIQPIPASEQHLCQYIAYLAMAGLAHSTIKCYLSAVCHLHIAENAGISRMPRLEQVLRGVKRTQARSKSKVKERLPITMGILDTLRKFWSDKGSAEAGMLWATASLCFFGFFRSGELTVPTELGYEVGAHLGVQDAAWLTLRFCKSRSGRRKLIPSGRD